MQQRAQRYFIQEHLHNNVFHGGIGNIDIERIFVREGFTPILFPYHDSFSLKAKWVRYLYLMKVAFSIPPGSILCFQFPLYARMHKLLLRILAWRKSVQVICLVADINGLKDADEQLLEEEIRALRQFKYFIVHGEAMDQWLKTYVPDAITSKLYFFDFLTSGVERAADKNASIVFAGNLAKSAFIHDLHKVAARHAIHFNVYGPEPGSAFQDQSNVHYKGVFDPYALPSTLEGAYGLLWDGSSVEGPGGNYGDYMQYISHHKLSLYVISGLPIIAFDKAGSADMIKALNIGITVSSLYEIGDKLAAITDSAYLEMQENMKPVARCISNGENLKTAIAQLMEVMDKQR